jgi:hypothetical protein
MGSRATGVGASLLLLVLAWPADAQAELRDRAIRGANVQKLANAIVGLMSYTVAPDVTTSSLAIDNAGTSDAGLSLTQFGGGFTWSKESPLYLEGNAAYSRYDPVSLVSEGTERRPVPVRWNSFSATNGTSLRNTSCRSKS